MKREKGITLVALVVTIIILLILAGITISTLSGDNGLFAKAKQARKNTIDAQKAENGTLIGYEDTINSIVDGTRDVNDSNVLWEYTDTYDTINLSDDLTNYEEIKIYIESDYGIHSVLIYDTSLMVLNKKIQLYTNVISGVNPWVFITEYTITDFRTLTYSSSGNFNYDGLMNSEKYIRPYKIIGIN